ncbi:head maturation protease, ClpP-related [Fictibacillus sp. Mic-4]|uniref:head maturation protease, ClpP-related n=1 Tax=Fictibacillus sp. Mic-4 TaxID=3132826 RepID=UPI003CF83354
MKHKIEGDIISWNSSIWDFNYKMKNVKDDEDIELEINSYGGDLFLGIDICNTLKSHQGNVTVTITGIAASAASLICMGADKIKAHANTMMMVHNAWTYAAGNAKDLRKVADDLEKMSMSAMKSYTHRIDKDTIQKLMDEETFLTADECLEYGLIDEIIDAEPETVESEVFQNKVKEINSKLASKKSAIATSSIAVIDEEMVQSMISKLEEKLRNEIKKLKNQKEKEPAPDPVQPKQNLGKLFLNL